MITLPFTVRVGTSRGTKSLVLETIPDIVNFLNSEELDYMYSESQMDVAVFASMLNTNNVNVTNISSNTTESMGSETAGHR